MVHIDESIVEVKEIIGHSLNELPAALDLMESSIEVGQSVRITICTEALPSDEVLDNLYYGMIAAGCHVSKPVAGIIEDISTTQFVLQKGSPAWAVLVPLIVPLAIIGLITFGILKIETIVKALLPLVAIIVGGVIFLAVIVRAPATKYLERGERTPKKALAAR